MEETTEGNTLKRQRRTPRKGAKSATGVKGSDIGAGSDGESESDNENTPLTQRHNTVLDIDKVQNK